MTTTPENLTEERPNVKAITVTALIFLLLLSIAAWFIAPVFKTYLTIALGFCMAVANFVFLMKIVVKMLNQNYTGASVTVAWVVGKLALMVALFYLAFKVWQVDALFFAAGYLTVMISLMIHKGKPVS